MRSYRLKTFAEPLVEEQIQEPIPLGRQVVLDVAAAGLCHSDLHLADGYFDLGNGGRIDATRIVNPPRTLGHEVVGTVRAVGPDVTEVVVGDRRVIYPWIGCGQCGLCRAGDEHLCSVGPRVVGIQCDGGFAEQVVVPDPKYLVAYGDMPEAQACTYACAGLTAFGALKKLLPFPRKGAWLAIGAGGVGLSALRFATALGLPMPIVAERDRSKWALIRETGVDTVIDPTEPDTLRTLRRATGGGVHGAIDFVGSSATFTLGLDSLLAGGKLVCVGLFGGSSAVSPAVIAMKSVSICGSMVGSLADMHEMMEIVEKAKLSAMPVTTRPLREVNDAIEDLKSGRIHGRAVLLP